VWLAARVTVGGASEVSAGLGVTCPELGAAGTVLGLGVAGRIVTAGASVGVGTRGETRDWGELGLPSALIWRPVALPDSTLPMPASNCQRWWQAGCSVASVDADLAAIATALG